MDNVLSDREEKSSMLKYISELQNMTKHTLSV